MPRRDVPQMLLAILALLVVFVLAVAPAIDAPAKGKRDGKRDQVATETKPDRGARRHESGGRQHREQTGKRGGERTRHERDQPGGRLLMDDTGRVFPDIDDPYINEELLAEAAASGELYAPPQPPPVPRRVWDEDAAVEAPVAWEPVARIDAGLADDATRVPAVTGSTSAEDDTAAQSPFTHGWVLTSLLLQEDLAGDDPPPDPGDGPPSDPGDGPPAPGSESPASEAPAPVPVEEGVVVTNDAAPEKPARETQPDTASTTGMTGDSATESDPLDVVTNTPSSGGRSERRSQESRVARDEDPRRDEVVRAPVSPRRDTASAADTTPDSARSSTRAQRRAARAGGEGAQWSDDRNFAGGSARMWDPSVEIAGTSDETLYRTQRTGSGVGPKRGFSYAIPVDGSGAFLVRLYFAEPLWGTPAEPGAGDGRRVFSVTAEGKTVLEDLDIYAEAGSLTALVKETNIEVNDGELNLQFTASAGQPLVAAIEVLSPAS